MAPSLHRSLGDPPESLSKTEMRCTSQARRVRAWGPEPRVSGACLVLAAYQHVGMAHQAREPFGFAHIVFPALPKPWM